MPLRVFIFFEVVSKANPTCYILLESTLQELSNGTICSANPLNGKELGLGLGLGLCFVDMIIAKYQTLNCLVVVGLVTDSSIFLSLAFSDLFAVLKMGLAMIGKVFATLSDVK